MNRTRIVATIGPATCNADSLSALAASGMNVARLNASHADLNWHARAIAEIRRALPEVPIILDVPGRKIRTLALAHEPHFQAGDTIVLTTDADHDGREKVPLSHDGLHEDLSPGDVIFADDGSLRFTVTAVTGRDISCSAETTGTLRSRKGINVPNVHLRGNLVTDRDREIIAFARDHDIDFVGISFVESGDHVDEIRGISSTSWPRIVAKIETQRAMENLVDIIGCADVIMIDRGDLAVETNVESTALQQKQVLKVAKQLGKPVIVATEMLHSMIQNPVPTKAEVSDITNAVLDGCAATMLSGETAIGQFPVEAVSVMRKICDAAMPFVGQLSDRTVEYRETHSIPQAMESAIATLCEQLPVTKIVAITVSGFAARVLASRLWHQPILAVSNDVRAARSFNLLPGTQGVHVDLPFERTSTDHIAACLKDLWRRGKLDATDLVLVTAVGYPKSGNRMNLIQTHYVADLVSALGWRRSPGTM